MIQYLKWDSDFFNLKIGKVITISDDIINHMAAEDFDLLYVFIDPPSEKTDAVLQKYNLNILDSKVVFSKNVSAISDDNEIDDFTITDSLEQIIRLSIQSGHKSRFKLDKNFENGKFEELYNIWIRKAIDDTKNNKVFVYRENKKLGGFVTVEINNGVGIIRLIAVDNNLRSKGIGSKLLNHVESYLSKTKINVLEVATQLDNIEACAFYKKLGFEIKETINIYHLWKV